METPLNEKNEAFLQTPIFSTIQRTFCFGENHDSIIRRDGESA